MTFPPLRTWILALSSALLLLSISYLLMGRLGLFLGLSLSILWNYVMLLHHHKTAVEFYQGFPIQGQDPWKLNEVLRQYEEKMRCPRISLYLCQKTEPLFLISIARWQKPTLLISEGLIRLLNHQELEALLVLGVSSVKHRNTFPRYSLDRMALTWLSLGQFSARTFQPLEPIFGATLWNFLNRFNLVQELCLNLAYFHWKLAFPKSLQSKADSEAFKTLTKPRSLATALWKIHGVMDAHHCSVQKNFAYQSLLGSSRSRRTAFQFTLPIEHRLQHLVGYFPI